MCQIHKPQSTSTTIWARMYDFLLSFLPTPLHFTADTPQHLTTLPTCKNNNKTKTNFNQHKHQRSFQLARQIMK